jgi:hypothetical protein
MNAHTQFPDPAVLEQIAIAAKAQVDRDIARGVVELCCEPWRANRVVPHATSMSLSALAVNVARRLPGAADFNRRMGLLQVRAALATEAFQDAWIKMREREPT